MDWRVPLADLDYGAEEESAVLAVLRSRWLTMGAVTQHFEERFAALTGSRYALAVGNGTQALHLACLALGIGAGDEIIVPSLSFVATANAVLYTGAQVRFADIHGDHDLTLDPNAVEAAVTPRTRAVIVMHYGGYPCDMPAILALAQQHGLAVIEDAAHAPGASLDGRALGTWSDIGCFSFFSNKNLATGEGGMLATDRAHLAERLCSLRSHGMTSLTYDRHQGHAFSYDVTALGYNDRIDELRSALGLAQLDKLARNNARRSALVQTYRAALAPLGLELPFVGVERGQPAHHIFPILLPAGTDRAAFMRALRDIGVQSSIHYPPIHTFSYYRQRYGDLSLPRTEAAAARELTLPLFPTMTAEQQKIVIDAVQVALNEGRI